MPPLLYGFGLQVCNLAILKTIIINVHYLINILGTRAEQDMTLWRRLTEKEDTCALSSLVYMMTKCILFSFSYSLLFFSLSSPLSSFSFAPHSCFYYLFDCEQFLTRSPSLRTPNRMQSRLFRHPSTHPIRLSRIHRDLQRNPTPCLRVSYWAREILLRKLPSLLPSFSPSSPPLSSSRFLFLPLPLLLSPFPPLSFTKHFFYL